MNETGFELSRIMSVVASSFQDSQSDASDASSGVKSDAPISLALPESLVVRLCFATKLVSDANGRVLPLPHSPLTGTKCKEVLTVAPGHVVMSELVRRQLKVGGCDVVRVCGVKEEGRMPVGSRHVTVHLRPLNEQSSIMKTVSTRTHTHSLSPTHTLSLSLSLSYTHKLTRTKLSRSRLSRSIHRVCACVLKRLCVLHVRERKGREWMCERERKGCVWMRECVKVVAKNVSVSVLRVR